MYLDEVNVFRNKGYRIGGRTQVWTQRREVSILLQEYKPLPDRCSTEVRLLGLEQSQMMPVCWFCQQLASQLLVFVGYDTTVFLTKRSENLVLTRTLGIWSVSLSG